MFHIFHFLQSDMVFEIVNSFSLKANTSHNKKRVPISMYFLLTYIDVRTVKIFPPAKS